MKTTVELVQDGTPAVDSDLAEERIRIATGGMTVVAGTIIAQGLSMVATLWIARRLGPDEYGLLTLATTLLLPLAALASLGLGRSLVRFIPVHIGNRDNAQVAGVLSTAFTMAGVASVIVALATILLSAPIANTVFSEPRLAPVLRVLAISIPLIVLTNTALAATRGSKVMLFDAIGQVAGPVFRILAWGAGLLLLASPLMAAISATLIQWLLSALLALGFAYVLFRKYFANGITWSFTSLWIYSSPLVLSSLMYTLVPRMDRLVLGIVGDTYVVGVYSLAASLVLILNLAHASVVKIFLPVVADAYNRISKDRARMLYITVTRWDTRLTFAVVVTSILLAQEILGLLGERYSEAIQPFIILAVAVYISTIPGPTGAFLQMTNRQKVEAANAVAFFVLSPLVQLGLALWLGWIGVAIGVLIVAVLLNLVQIIEIYRIYHFHPFQQGHFLFSSLSIAVIILCAFVGLREDLVLRVALLGLVSAGFLGILYLTRTPGDALLVQLLFERTRFGRNKEVTK